MMRSRSVVLVLVLWWRLHAILVSLIPAWWVQAGATNITRSLTQGVNNSSSSSQSASRRAFCAPNCKAHLNVGAVFPTLTASGDPSLDGALRVAAFVLAINDVNADPNILRDVQISTIIRDTRHDFGNTLVATVAMTTANPFPHFTPHGIHAGIGAVETVATAAMAAVMKGADLPQISYGCSASEFSHADLYPQFLRLYPSDALQGTAMAHVLAKNGWYRVVAFVSSDTLGADTMFEFTNVCNSIGIDIVAKVTFLTGTTDFSSAISSVLPYECLINVFFITNPSDMSILLLTGTDSGLFFEESVLMFTTSLVGTPQAYAATVDAYMKKYGPDAVVSLMTGNFVIEPNVQEWKTTPIGKTFLQRLLGQANTITVLPDGTKVCHNETDDSGAFIYKEAKYPDKPNSPTLCTGVQFDQFAKDGSNSSGYTGFVYDAAYALFRTYDYMIQNNIISLSELNSSTIDGRLVKKVAVENITMSGVTGFIDFAHGRGGSQVYGYGDRFTGLGFDVLNFQPLNSSYGAFRRVASWTTAHGWIDCNASEPAWLGGCHAPIQYGGGYGYTPPPDRIHDVIQEIPLGVRGACIALAVLTALVATALSIVLFCVKRSTALVKLSQPLMMAYIIGGVYLASIRIGLSAASVSVQTCHANDWFGHLSFAFIFFAMGVKTWRVYMIVRGGLKRVTITSAQVFAYTTGLNAVVVVILVLFSTIGQPYVTYRREPLITGNQILKPECGFVVPYFDYILYGIEGIALFVASFWSYKMKDIPTVINEGKFIALAVALIVFVSIAGLPIVLALPLEPYVTQMIVSILFFVGATGSSLIFFGNKVYLLLLGADLNAQLKIVYKDGSIHGEVGEKQIEQSHALRAANEGDLLADVSMNEAMKKEFRSSLPAGITYEYCAAMVILWLKKGKELEQDAAGRSRSSGDHRRGSHSGSSGGVSGSQQNRSSVLSRSLFQTENRLSVNHAAPEVPADDDDGRSTVVAVATDADASVKPMITMSSGPGRTGLEPLRPQARSPSAAEEEVAPVVMVAGGGGVDDEGSLFSVVRELNDPGPDFELEERSHAENPLWQLS